MTKMKIALLEAELRTLKFRIGYRHFRHMAALYATLPQIAKAVDDYWIAFAKANRAANLMGPN